MEFTSESKISEELVNSFNQEMTCELSKKLAEDNFLKPFHGTTDCYLFKALAINSSELTSDYIHLFNQEKLDEI